MNLAKLSLSNSEVLTEVWIVTEGMTQLRGFWKSFSSGYDSQVIMNKSAG